MQKLFLDGIKIKQTTFPIKSQNSDVGFDI